MNKIKRYYDIKFPFTNNNKDGLFIDLNQSIEDKCLSDLLHVILTPKRTRVRMPEFGTDLIKFIWEPNDELLWENIEGEIKNSVKTYVKNTTLDKIDIFRDENNDNKIILSIYYSVTKGNKVLQKQVNVPL